MPSSIAHALTAVAVGTVVYPSERTWRLYASAAAGAALLDIDAIGRPFGLGDVSWLGGHRALTHSLPFAAILAAVLVVASRQPDARNRRLGLWCYFALAFALHGVLDAFTAYGEGVMFFAPFSVARFKAPWQPFEGILPEIVGVWIPAIAIILYGRRSASRRMDA